MGEKIKIEILQLSSISVAIAGSTVDGKAKSDVRACGKLEVSIWDICGRKKLKATFPALCW